MKVKSKVTVPVARPLLAVRTATGCEPAGPAATVHCRDVTEEDVTLQGTPPIVTVLSAFVVSKRVPVMVTAVPYPPGGSRNKLLLNGSV